MKEEDVPHSYSHTIYMMGSIISTKDESISNVTSGRLDVGQTISRYNVGQAIIHL